MNTTQLKNTKYNICLSYKKRTGRSKRFTYYVIQCANQNCNNIINVRKSHWEEQLPLTEPKTFCCSNECRHSKHMVNIQGQRKIIKYGNNNFFLKEETREKAKKTLFKNYGVDNISKTEHFKTKSKETWLKKYGVDNPNKLKTITDKSIKTRKERYGENLIGICVKDKTFETNLLKYGSKYFFSSQDGSMTLENFIKRHGEEKGLIKWNEKINNCKQTLENFIKRHGIKEGHLRYENWKSTCVQTLENFIKRHGEIEGSIMYEQHTKRLVTNLLKNGRHSQLNNTVESILLELTPINNLERELMVKKENKGHFFYDFYLKKENCIIEVHGDFWHCNPIKYQSEDLIRYPGRKEKVIVKEIWKRDEAKKEFAISKGFRFITVWEKDIRTNIEEVKKTLKQTINEYTEN